MKKYLKENRPNAIKDHILSSGKDIEPIEVIGLLLYAYQ